MPGLFKKIWQGVTSAIPVVGPLLGGIFEHSRAGYETSPGRRAFLDTVRNEQRIFERDAAYNSPEAQMQRFKDAGLNPNLIYGQGSPGNVTGTAPSAQGNVKLDVVAQILQATMMKKEIEFKDAQIDAIKTNTRLSEERIGSEDAKQLRMAEDLRYLKQRYPQLMVQLEAGNEKALRENRIGDQTEEFSVQKRMGEAILISNRISVELQRLNLMEKDGSIRDEILKSKQLQNALLNIQHKFLSEGEMNPQMLWQAILNTLSRGITK